MPLTHAQTIDVLNRLLAATRDKRVAWQSDDNEWFSTRVGDREFNFRFLYLEAAPQIGADRYLLEFHMPGLNACFACGTEGYDLLYRIYVEASDDATANDGLNAIDFLDSHGL